MKDLDAPDSAIKEYKKLLCRSAGIFKFGQNNRRAQSSTASQDKRKRSLISKKREYKI